VHAFARRRVAAEAVDDVVSEAFTVAWRRLDDIPDDPLPWLLGVARNVVGTARRGEARRLRLQSQAQADW
jgi:RNA polymerase sigma-70 factor (ECF subfamily)